MKTGRSIALGALAAGALALGTAAFAQDAKTQKPEAKPQTQESHEHRVGHGERHGGMQRMSEKHGGCQEQSGQGTKQHEHS